jgi:hypothetical protein
MFIQVVVVYNPRHFVWVSLVYHSMAGIVKECNSLAAS